MTGHVYECYTGREAVILQAELVKKEKFEHPELYSKAIFLLVG